MSRSKRVLIVVQNLPVPFDRRVWMECQALVAAGIGVSVICPKGPGDPWRQRIDGVCIYKYPPPPQASGTLGYAVEFAYCWLWTALLSVVVHILHGFAALQACNPPDTYFALGWLWKLAGKKFVYDQHDLNPEVYLSRFESGGGIKARTELRCLYALEQATFKTADHVIATNESYRAVAISRGSVDPLSVTVVRSGPDTSVMRPLRNVKESLRHGRRFLAVYLGIMGPQDGVDATLHALDILVHKYGREDCHLALMGFGDCLEDLKLLSRELNLEEFVTFTGRVDRDTIAEYLSAAHLGLGPDPKSPLNDVSTMNKTMEYMSYGLPIVTFDLVETRVSAGEAAVYVPSGDIEGFAEAWSSLLDDERRRVVLGGQARDRVVAHLDWASQAEAYVRVWRDVLDIAPTDLRDPATWPDVDRRREGAQATPTDRLGRPFLDLRAHAAPEHVLTLPAQRGSTNAALSLARTPVVVHLPDQSKREGDHVDKV